MNELMSTDETALILSISPRTLRRNAHLIAANHALTPIRVGRYYRFNRKQVERLLAKLTRTGEPLYYMPGIQELAAKAREK